jgi:6-phosphogluconolactonase
MERYELIKFDSPDELAVAVAARFWQAAEAARSGPGFSVALSGGRIAAKFFDAAAQMALSEKLSGTGIQFFWSDERSVPPNDPESNYALAAEHFLRRLAVPEAQIHRIRGEEPPEPAAALATEELKPFAQNNAAGQPILDLIFLGMGEEGHTASLFPGESEEVMNSPAVFRPTVVPKPPPQRITMGYPVLAAAREVWLLASGAGKKEALSASLQPDAVTPVGRLLKLRSRTMIFTDISL